MQRTKIREKSEYHERHHTDQLVLVLLVVSPGGIASGVVQWRTGLSCELLFRLLIISPATVAALALLLATPSATVALELALARASLASSTATAAAGVLVLALPLCCNV